MIGSANNKAKTLRMEHVNGRKFTEKKRRRKRKKVEEIQLANLASPGSLASKNGLKTDDDWESNFLPVADNTL